MVRLGLLGLLILLGMPVFAARNYAIIVNHAVLVPVQGQVFLVRDKERTLIRKACSVGEGDEMLLTGESQAVFQFEDGTQQVIQGEAQIKVSPIFSTKPFVSWNSIKHFFSHLI